MVQRSVKSVLLRHSKSRTLVSVSTSPLRTPVTCRATSGTQSPWSGGRDRAPPDQNRAERHGEDEEHPKGPATEKRNDRDKTKQHEQAGCNGSPQTLASTSDTTTRVWLQAVAAAMASTKNLWRRKSAAMRRNTTSLV